MRTMHKMIPGLLLALLTVSWAASPAVAGLPTLAINLPASEFAMVADDDDVPEVTDRVARISFIRGEARVRRLGSDEWEKVTQNLPLVEGDEISTEVGGALEIQFDKNQHLRLDANTFLKLVNLKDEGIAVSLSLGSMSLRIFEFDKDRAFFEIDAPKTTLAVQRSGRYRVDAGRDGDIEVRASVSEGGEARLYSENAGYTLKDGRSTRIYIGGPNIGEVENGADSRYNDDFSEWVLERETIIAQRLKDAYYDKYYDQDIYGAEELDDNGDWIYIPDYGQVWRPNRVATSQYSDWSPYRYGTWRWMQPYGWIWVNDEPWGWATYHHGRWISHNGYWVWSPYGYYRSSRSWWSPAFVVINVYNNNVCWYPLPYHRRRYNYNWNHQTPRVAKVSSRRPRIGTGPVLNPPPGRGLKVSSRVPPTGVVAVDAKDFGSTRSPVKTVPPVVATTILTKDPVDGRETNLPGGKERRRLSDIAAEKSRISPSMQPRVGAAPRKTDAPLDGELRTKRIFGGRDQQPLDGPTPPVRSNEPRKTGAVDRVPVVRQVDPIKSVDDNEPQKVRRASPVREMPTYKPPVKSETPRSIERESPRYDPPKQSERSRPEAPVKQQPPTRSEPPPTKSEPKSGDKPAAPSRREKPDSK